MRDRRLAAQSGANGRLTRYIHACRQPAFPSGALEFCAGSGGCQSTPPCANETQRQLM